MVAAGRFNNLSDLAKDVGVSRQYVWRSMRLLDLHPDIKKFVRELTRGTRRRDVMADNVVKIARLPVAQQLDEATGLLHGFEMWSHQRLSLLS